MPLDWKGLVIAMVATGEFHPSGLEAQRLQSDYENGNAELVSEGDRIVAYAAVEHYPSAPWCPVYEIRRVFVASGNGNGTAENLIGKLMARFTPSEEEKQKKNPAFFLISKNPAIWHIASKLGFRMVTKYTMPNVREWARAIGLGKRLPRSATAHNPHHSKRRKRWLMMR
jgi:hypothetical protein